MQLLSALLLPLYMAGVHAFPSGGGGCPTGNAVLGSIHTLRPTVVTGTLAKGGLTVSIDGKTITPGTPVTFRSGVPHVLSVKAATNKVFKGFMFRIGDSGTNALLISPNYKEAQASALCLAKDASGITQLDATIKNYAEVILNIKSPDTTVTLDITVVVMNTALKGEHYHSAFSLKASSTAPTPPTAAPNTAPTFPLNKQICSKVTADIEISGSSTVLPVATRWASGYFKTCEHRVAVAGGGSSVGARAVCQDKSKNEPSVDIGNMSREWKSSEAVLEKEGVYKCLIGNSKLKTIKVAVALDGLTVATLIAEGGGAACIEKLGGLSLDQLRWIFSSYTEAKLSATGWKGIGNSDGDDKTHLWSELNPLCAKNEILIGGEGQDSGTHAYFTEAVFTDLAKGEYFRSPYFSNANPDVVTTQFITGCKFCIAYFGFAYYSKNLQTLQPAAIRNNAGDYIAPTADTVNSGVYNPLSRTVYMMVNANRRQKVEGLFKYGFSDAGDADIVATGLVPLPAAKQANMLSLINPFCFTGDSEVQVLNKGVTKMWDLAIGDMVKVAGNKYEAVYTFGHKDVSIETEFVSIVTKGRKPLELSRDHMVLLEGERYIPAQSVEVGDNLVSGSGELVNVLAVRSVHRKGAFAPFTRSGAIVVNDIVASNYIAYSASQYLEIGDIETPLTYQWLGQTFNSVHRVCYMMGIKIENYTAEGISHWVHAGHKGAEWLIGQNIFVVVLVLLASFAFFGLFSLIEAALLSPITTAALVAGLIVARPSIFKVVSTKKA